MTESQGGDASPKLWGARRDAPLQKLGLMTLARLPQLPRCSRQNSSNLVWIRDSESLLST